MKTIKESASIHAMSLDGGISRCKLNSFKAGVSLAQRWIPVDEDLPEIDEIVQVKVLASGTKDSPKSETFYDHDKLIVKEKEMFLFSIEQQCGLKVISWRPIELK